jgi:ankyrin repeat protein
LQPQAFVDPRENPLPERTRRQPRTTSDPALLADLQGLCRHGRLYDVERWVRSGAPLQLATGVAVRGRARGSPLAIALEAGNQALILLLLANGYDPNLGEPSPLDRALRDRRMDLVDLLLKWGADPRRVDPDEVFDTYDTQLFERFRALGVDFAEDHALAYALGYHTSNKPLFGYARRHRHEDPRIQQELNIALVTHASKGNEKGVALCLWAGADPHAPAPSLSFIGHGWYDEESEEGEEDSGFRGFTAIYEACLLGHANTLRMLGPDPALDDFQDLYLAASDRWVVEELARIQPLDDAGRFLASRLGRIWRHEDGWRTTGALECVFKHGARWRDGTPELIAAVRHDLLRTSTHVFVDVMKLLARADHCTPDIRLELARTPAMRRRMKEVGFIPPDDDDRRRYVPSAPTGTREVLRQFGVELPKPEWADRLPPTVWIGIRPPGSQEVRMTRAELLDRVWSQPVSQLALQWGISDRGLGKACRRLQIPVPPRGYWAKLKAGRDRRRPKLPALPKGQADEVVVWVPPAAAPAPTEGQ